MKKVMTLDILSKTANEVIKNVRDLSRDTATLITLSGDLGTGKTTLTQEIAASLGIKEQIISPTFVIIKKYSTTDPKFKNLIHIDAYRLGKSEELMKLGWHELLGDKDNLVILEWPENVPDCIPKDVFKIVLYHLDDNTRSIEF